MTKEELKAHCEKEIKWCEFWAHGKSEELNNNKIYQEHKLVLELLEQESKTGYWIFYGRLLKCSNCGSINDDMLDICPNCGAKMESEEVNESNN